MKYNTGPSAGSSRKADFEPDQVLEAIPMLWLQSFFQAMICFSTLLWIQGDLKDAQAEPLTLQDLVEMFEQERTVTLEQSGVTISSCHFVHEACKSVHEKTRVEAISFRPRGEGPFPGVLLIPGYSRSARDYIPVGLTLARVGFGAMAVSQRGFGRSEGEPDWVGPATISALRAGYERFCRTDWVDANRTAVFGYSRGAVAAAILAVRIKGLKAAVCAAGIYDLAREYETNKIPGIRANMEKETGLTEEAFRERSPLFMVEDLECPLLILHGEKDVNASVEQAKLLRDRLDELKKDYEIRLFADRDHNLGRQNLHAALLDFLERRLKAKK